MTQLSQTSITGQTIARGTAARLANEYVVMPYCRSYTETTIRDGEFDVVNLAGIPTPDVGPAPSNVGGTGPTGTGYSWYITFYDQTRDREGNGVINTGGAVNITDDTYRLTRADTNSAANGTVTHWRAYRNLSPSGSIYYRLATIAIGTITYDDSATDATISANDTYETDNNPPAVNTYGISVAHKSRMFLAGPHDWDGGTAYDHGFIWSKTNEPWAYPPENATKIEPGRYGIIRAVHPSGDRLVFYKDSAIYELHFNTNPSGITGDGFGKTVNTVRGAVNQNAVVNVQGTHYVLDKLGIYAFTGGTTVVDLSARLAKYWRRINWDVRSRFSGVATNDRVYFFVALDRDTECRFAFVLDLTAQRAGRGVRWYLEQYNHGIRDACRFNFGSQTASTTWGLGDSIGALVITEYGFVGALGMGFRDFLDPQLTASGTATGGSTTTLECTSATFTRTNENSLTSSVVGAYMSIQPSAVALSTISTRYGQQNFAYPSYGGNNVFRITGVSGTTITFTPAAPDAIAAGATFIIGGVPNAVYKTPLMSFGAPRVMKKLGKAEMEFQPGGHNFTIDFGTSKDRRGPDEVGTSQTEDPYTATAGNPMLTVDMGGELEDDARVGFQSLPTGERACHYAQLILDGSGVDKPAIVDNLIVTVEDILG